MTRTTRTERMCIVALWTGVALAVWGAMYDINVMIDAALTAARAKP